MSRVETIGDCVLYLGACEEIIPTLGKIDAVITDPPYKMEIHGRGFAAKRDYYGALDYGTSTTFELSDKFYQDLLSVLNEVNMIFFCNKYLKHDIISWGLSKGFSFDELSMLKSSPAPLTNNQWLPDKECVVHIWNDDTWGGVHVFNKAQVKGDYKTKCSWFLDTNYQDRSINHPSVKPVYILDRILRNITNEGAIILDPFMGSGTTGVAAINLGRKFIGIEIDSKHFDEACRRIEAVYNNPQLFSAPKLKPQNENFNFEVAQ